MTDLLQVIWPFLVLLIIWGALTLFSTTRKGPFDED